MNEWSTIEPNKLMNPSGLEEIAVQIAQPHRNYMQIMWFDELLQSFRQKRSAIVLHLSMGINSWKSGAFQSSCQKSHSLPSNDVIQRLWT